MARKMSFNSMIEETQMAAAVVPAEDVKERLLKMLDKTLAEDGKQGAMKPLVFPKEGEYEAFRGEVEKFYDELSEDLKPGRIYVTNSDDCDFHVEAIQKKIYPKFSLFLEEDKNRKGGGKVLRIILNKENIPARLKAFFEELDFKCITPKLMNDLISRMDDRGGIDIVQLTMDDFKNKFGDRKDWFRFGDAYAVYDEGVLILTHQQWKRSVSLRMPTDGRKPWRYRYLKDENGFRYKAEFRANLYGALWFEPVGRVNS